jgi:hypothetical protein
MTANAPNFGKLTLTQPFFFINNSHTEFQLNKLFIRWHSAKDTDQWTETGST